MSNEEVSLQNNITAVKHNTQAVGGRVSAADNPLS